MKLILSIVGILFLATVAQSQEKPLSYQLEIGSLVSIGPNHYRKDSVQINNITSIFYADRLRYEHPSIRIRLASLYKIGNHLSAGIEAGGNFRFGESFYNNEVLFSIPVQIKTLYTILDINKEYSLALDATIGYHFRNYYKIPTTEQGGLIYSSSIVLANKTGRNINWYTKLGFENQTEQLRITIFARDPGQTDQDYAYKRYRSQLLFSMGLTLN